MIPKRYDAATVARLEARIAAASETVRRMKCAGFSPDGVALAEAEGYLAWLQSKRDRPPCRCGSCYTLDGRTYPTR